MKVKRYQLLINLYGCKIDFSKKNISEYINKLCRLIKMEKHGKLFLWEDFHNRSEFLKGGISAMQFIKTSSIVLHSFEKSNQCFIDIFSCKNFDFKKAGKFSKEFFEAGKLETNRVKS